MQQEIYWNTFHRDVESYCRCPMDCVAVDVLGLFPQTPRGNWFEVVAMDYFTKWLEAYAVPSQEAGAVAEVLLEGMFACFEVPAEVHSEHGRNFESQLFSDFCQQLGIRKTRTTSLHLAE
ncbi:hypothetical protein QQF64_010008 [Cirrhinus molitorella]|uniref:Integrase catalytic domain-containing protein n=1 Tax=Cirrhinus molitorella TaxID=172907 RepID=A0ABR3M2S1_9TELE